MTVNTDITVMTRVRQTLLNLCNSRRSLPLREHWNIRVDLMRGKEDREMGTIYYSNVKVVVNSLFLKCHSHKGL